MAFDDTDQQRRKSRNSVSLHGSIIKIVNTRFFCHAILLVTSINICAQDAKKLEEPLARRASLGIGLAPLTDADKKLAEVTKGKGLKITQVVPGLSGDAAKLKAGDIVYKFDGKVLDAPTSVAPATHGKRAGTKATFEIIREGKLTKVEVVLVGKPFVKEEGMVVEYDQVVSNGKRIRMITTHPAGDGPFPTVFLIGGIGAYSIDNPFASMSYGNIIGPIAKSGYATVRMDKPGQGDSEGPLYSDLLFDDELDAYLQVLRKAKTKSYIDAKRIAIFGHSMGGAFGPLLAAVEPIRGVAVCGTMSKTWVEYNLENTRRQMLLAGANGAETDAYLREYSAINHLIYNEGLSPKQIISKYPRYKAVMMDASPDLKTFSGVGIPFFQQLANKNLMEAWSKSNCKVLTLWGENDFISTEWDHGFVADTLNKAKAGTAKYVKIPNSDHGFTTTSSQLDSMTKWGRPGGVFNPNIIEILKGWLQEVL
jgi:pimeloyl-ACP methyl ester carboxylesterase